MVAGFIALKNVTLTMALLGQAIALPSGGVAKVTVGWERGSVGFPALASLSLSPHPMAKLSSRSAVK
jgi:hypothetical protein